MKKTMPRCISHFCRYLLLPLTYYQQSIEETLYQSKDHVNKYSLLPFSEDDSALPSKCISLPTHWRRKSSKSLRIPKMQFKLSLLQGDIIATFPQIEPVNARPQSRISRQGILPPSRDERPRCRPTSNSVPFTASSNVTNRHFKT
jgi:hypothetical protein